MNRLASVVHSNFRIRHSALECRGWDSNPHASRRTILSRMRLPIPPPRRFVVVKGDHGRTRTSGLYLRRVALYPLSYMVIVPPEWQGSPNGTRTRVSTLRGWCPRPLDDGAVPGDRGRTRTYNPLIKSQLLCQLSYTAIFY
jgi:hypothetical protein